MSDTPSGGISGARLRRIIGKMRGRRMIALGDWMLDRYVWGTATRLSPEAAVPVLDFTRQSECLGGAGNVAANLAALGAKVIPFGVVGADEEGKAVRAALGDLKLSDAGLLVENSRPTTVKTRIIARHQQVVRVDRESRAPLSETAEVKLSEKVVAALRNAEALVISDYDKGVVTDGVCARILSACQRLKIAAFVKPKWSRLPTYRGAMAIVCNRAEAGFLVTRSLESKSEVEEAGKALLEHFGCAAVAITRGEQGLTVCEHDRGSAFHVAAISRERPFGQVGAVRRHAGREVFDVTGAGDTVLATLALAVAAGGTMREAAVLGNAAAGVVVGKLGTATLTQEELLEAVEELA